MDYKIILYFLEAFFINYRFFIVLVLLGLLCLLIYTRKRYAVWNNGWLSELIKAEEPVNLVDRKSTRHALKVKYSFVDLFNNFLLEKYDFFSNRFKNKVKKDIKNFYAPSLSTLAVICVLIIILFIFSHTGVPYESILDINKWKYFLEKEFDNNGVANVVSIVSGLVSVVFALVIFVTESIRDSKNLYQKRTLLKISWLWPLIVFTVFSLLNFSIFKINIFSLIFPLIIGCLSISSFWKIIDYLINPSNREEEDRAFFKQRIKDNINESIKERIGNNILFKKVGYDNDIKFEYTFSKSWLPDNVDDYIFIESESDGKIIDVNIEELSRLFNYLKTQAEELKFKICPGGVNTTMQDNSEVIQLNDVRNDYKKVYLLKKFGEYIPPKSVFAKENKTVFAIPKEFEANQFIVSYVQSLIPHIFRFSKKQPSSEIFRMEIKDIKDKIINFIKSSSLGGIEKLTTTYLDLAEIFLESINKYGGGYSVEQAKKERGNFFEGWSEIKWLREDIRDLIQIASDSDNKDILSEIIFLPTAISIRSLYIKDHFLFQEFLSFNKYIYYLSTEKPDGKMRRYMVEHSWRYLKELSYLYIEPKIKNIKDDVSAEDMLNYKDFALFTIKVFQDLIKESFDKNDFKSFSEFFSEFSSVYKNIKDHEYPNSAHLTASLSRITDPEEKNRVEDKINKLKNKEDAIKNILLAKKQVTFAIVSKLFDVYRRDHENSDVKKFFELVHSSFNLSIKELTSVFDSIRNFEVEDFWGWDNWEIVADGEVHSIDVSSKFDYYYCIKILTLIKNKTDDQIRAIDLPYSRNLAFLAEEREGTLVSKLNEIKNTPTNWEWIIDSQSISKIDKFIELLNTAKEAQEHDEEEYLKTAGIDDEKLKEFRNKTVDGFKKSLKIRPLVELYKAYKDKTLEGPNQAISSYGYNQVYKKDAFVKDWHVSHGGLGEQYGSGMANSEDLIFFKTIVDGLNNKIDVVKDKLIETIREKIDEHSFDNPIIIQSLDYMVEYDSIKNSDYFIDKWKSDCPKTRISQLDGFLGVFKFGSKVVPIFDMFFREDDFNNKVAIIDLKELGVWEQYLPIDQAGDEQYVDDLLYIRVIDLNLDDEKRDKMIEDDPSWLQDESDKEGYLRQMVNIKIYEKFRFLMKDQPYGTIVSVTNVAEE